MKRRLTIIALWAADILLFVVASASLLFLAIPCSFTKTSAWPWRILQWFSHVGIAINARCKALEREGAR